MSLSRTFSSASSDSDYIYEDDYFYLIRKSLGDYRDEPFYYDGISDEELHHRLNIEFEEKVNWERYDIGFSKFFFFCCCCSKQFFIIMIQNFLFFSNKLESI